jgi:hypothetical protein
MTEAPPLLFGPYATPRFEYGDVASCAVRGDVRLCGLSAGPVPWPTCRQKRTGGGRLVLVVYGALADAVRRESATAVAHWFGVSMCTVWAWRKALGVGRSNEGTRALRRAAAVQPAVVAGPAKARAKAGDPERRRKIAEAKRGKTRPRHVVEAMRRGRLGKPHSAEVRARMSAAQRARGTRPPAAGRPWTADEDALLTLPVAEAARRTGRTVQAVRDRRRVLKSRQEDGGGRRADQDA